jgi:4-amino-4-deoxy-L-arabinose transferase-like glycosyltransferase
MKKLLERKELVLIIVILFFAAFLRLYHISDYMTFLGDEGRDSLVVRDIVYGFGNLLQGHFAVAQHQLTLLGPRASAGDFYTGPIYYYMMAPFLFLWNFNPVGPAIMIALLSVLTTYLMYRFGKEFFGTFAGLSAAALYAIAPVVIVYSRSSWNPNPMPFFTLLLLYLLYKGVVQRKKWLFGIVGILYGITLQLHYIELFTGLIIILFTLIGSFVYQKEKVKTVSQYALFLLAGFILGYAPFLAFEFRHGFANTKTIMSFILFGNGDPSTLPNHSFFGNVFTVFFRLFGDIVLYYPQEGRLAAMPPVLLWIWMGVVWVSGILSLLFLGRVKNPFIRLLFFLWIGVGVILFGFYKKPIYDYYFEFMFPVPFLLIGNGLQQTFASKRANPWGKYAASLALGVLILINLTGFPFQFEPNRQLNQMKTVSNFVLSKAGHAPFNFALLSGNNSDHAYRYFFATAGHDPVTIENTELDPRRSSVTKQLFVVCEFPTCQPLGNSLFEIAGFGRANIAGVWEPYKDIVKVYKLIPYTGDDKANNEKVQKK